MRDTLTGAQGGMIGSRRSRHLGFGDAGCTAADEARPFRSAEARRRQLRSEGRLGMTRRAQDPVAP